MAVSAVQNNNTNKSNRANYFKFALAGGLTGFALKYALPINSAEKRDGNYQAEIKKIAAEVEASKLAEIDAIRNSAKTDVVGDAFIKLHDAKKLTVPDIARLDDSISNKVMAMFTEFTQKAEYVSYRRTKSLDAYTKKIRPNSAFVGVGVVSAVVGALIHNISLVRKQDKKLAQKTPVSK